jgi:hypothetical protein
MHSWGIGRVLVLWNLFPVIRRVLFPDFSPFTLLYYSPAHNGPL